MALLGGLLVGVLRVANDHKSSPGGVLPLASRRPEVVEDSANQCENDSLVKISTQEAGRLVVDEVNPSTLPPAQSSVRVIEHVESGQAEVQKENSLGVLRITGAVVVHCNREIGRTIGELGDLHVQVSSLPLWYLRTLDADYDWLNSSYYRGGLNLMAIGVARGSETRLVDVAHDGSFCVEVQEGRWFLVRMISSELRRAGLVSNGAALFVCNSRMQYGPLLFECDLAAGERPESVEGVVVDEFGVGVPEVGVFVYSDVGGDVGYASSDDRGGFSCLLPEGNATAVAVPRPDQNYLRSKVVVPRRNEPLVLILSAGFSVEVQLDGAVKKCFSVRRDDPSSLRRGVPLAGGAMFSGLAPGEYLFYLDGGPGACALLEGVHVSRQAVVLTSRFSSSGNVCCFANFVTGQDFLGIARPGCAPFAIEQFLDGGECVACWDLPPGDYDVVSGTLAGPPGERLLVVKSRTSVSLAVNSSLSVRF